MAFDPELNLMYIGTGNGSPWAQKKRSPAGGDNLYLASIVALNPDTGKYVWHYQETPGDNWDFTSTQPMILADVDIDGKRRKVILHAPKNGFFFVIDRTNGQFISAKNFVDVNWATGYDAKGRPIETEIARVADRPREIIPDPVRRAQLASDVVQPADRPGLHAGAGRTDDADGQQGLELQQERSWRAARRARLESRDDGRRGAGRRRKPFGRLIAWDPVQQKEAWRVEHVSPWNGGTLATAGNLVFQGTADGRFVAYDAKNGAKLWEVPTGTGVVAAPATYEVDGKQYVSIAVGWGGVYGLVSARATASARARCSRSRSAAPRRCRSSSSATRARW